MLYIRLGVILLIVYRSSCATLKPDNETSKWVKDVYEKSQNTDRSSEEADLDLTPDIDKNECGWENSEVFALEKKENQIYANFGQFRWMVAIIKKGKKEAWNQDDYIGGGSIIHPSVVITAAHKVHKMQPHELKCRGGEWHTQTTNELYPYQERDVKNKTIHPNFFLTLLYYDAALLFLKDPFDLGVPHMGTACLSSVLPPPSTECYSMGWGKYAVVLKKVKLSLVSSIDCENSLKKSRLGPFFRLHSSLTCAGGEENVDTCEKDGGSSLVCPIGNDEKNVRYAVVGMVAYGIGVCGTKNRPGMYVNVPEIYSWVNEVMARETYGNATYTI